MSRNIASGDGYRYYTGSSRQEDNYDDGHGTSIISAAGSSNGKACGCGNCRLGGYSYLITPLTMIPEEYYSMMEDWSYETVL